MSIDNANTDGEESLKSIFESNDQFINNFYGSFKNLNSEKLFDSVYRNPLSGKNFIENGFNKIYEKKSEKIITDLKQSLSKLNDLRSNYVPWEIARVITSERNEIAGEAKAKNFEIGIPSNKFIIESYENCFMRAMGMPHSDDIIDAIKLGGEFVYLNINNFGSSPKQSKSDSLALFENILLQRELVETRVVKVSSDFFSFNPKSRNLESYVYGDKKQEFNKIVESYIDNIQAGSKSGFFYDKKLEKNFTAEELFQRFYSEIIDYNLSESSSRTFFYNNILGLSANKINVFSLDKEYKRIKSLLFPPVQNSSISYCISESSKIVERPFQNVNKKIINRDTPHTSFLETIIRIRLDKVTGLNYDKIVGVLKSSSASINLFQKNELKINDYSDLSLIENIIINRLRKALTVAVKNVEGDLQNYILSAGKSMSQPSSENKGKSGEESNTESKRKVNISEGLFGQNLSRLNYISSLKDLRSIDEAILFLLSDKEKISALDLISDGLRSSSLRDGLFLDQVVSSVSIVKNYLDEELNRVESFLKQKERDNNGSNESIEKIAYTIGIYKGIGYLDVLAFALTMFTVSEETLVGTLTSSQYLILKKEIKNEVFFKEIDDKNRGKKRSTVQLESLNLITKRLIEVYGFIQNMMGK